MGNKLFSLAVAVLAAALSFAGEPAYTCNLKVGAPKTDSTVKKSEGNARNGSESKTTTMTWPVKVSFAGKEIPKAVSLRAYFIGSKGDEAAVLGESSTDVTLDAATNSYKGEIASPPATFVKTKKSAGRGRNAKTTTEKSGDKITGCIVQLVVDGKVVKSFASKPTWKKLAQADKLDTEAVLKLR